MPAAPANGHAEPLAERLAIQLEDVQKAAERIRPYAHVTPVSARLHSLELASAANAWSDVGMCVQVLTCTAIEAIAGRELFFKAETFQKTYVHEPCSALLAALRPGPAF